MTVKELIKQLQEFDKNLDVWVDLDWTHCPDISLELYEKNGNRYLLITE